MVAIPRSEVHASVIDISADLTRVPAKCMVDANILYFCYYPGYAKGVLSRGSPQYQLRDYSAFLRNCLDKNVPLFTHAVAVCEFLRIVEVAELRLLHFQKTKSDVWLTARELKELKVRERVAYGRIQTSLLTHLNQVTKVFQLTGQAGNIGQTFGGMYQSWGGSLCEPADALQVSDGDSGGLDSLVTDDAELVTVKGVVVYTANQRAVAAARSAGKLI